MTRKPTYVCLGILTLFFTLLVGCSVKFYPATDGRPLPTKPDNCYIQVWEPSDTTTVSLLQNAIRTGIVLEHSELNPGDQYEYIGHMRIFARSEPDLDSVESTAKREACRRGADLIVLAGRTPPYPEDQHMPVSIRAFRRSVVWYLYHKTN